MTSVVAWSHSAVVCSAKPDKGDENPAHQWRLRLVELLEPDARTKVLVIGEHAGTTTAMLCAAIGEPHVQVAVETSVQAVRARNALARVGYEPQVLVGEEELVDKAGAYDRVLVDGVSPRLAESWTRALRPGGVLVAAIANNFGCAGVVRLEAGEHWLAGPFVALADQGELPTLGEKECYVFDARAESNGQGVRLEHAPPVDLWEQPDALFAVGLRLPRLRVARPGRTHVRWVFDSRSWCRIDVATGQAVGFGEACVAGAVNDAYRWWVNRGRPAYRSFGLTVAPFGRFAWYGSRRSGYIWSL